MTSLHKYPGAPAEPAAELGGKGGVRGRSRGRGAGSLVVINSKPSVCLLPKDSPMWGRNKDCEFKKQQRSKVSKAFEQPVFVSNESRSLVNPSRVFSQVCPPRARDVMETGSEKVWS